MAKKKAKTALSSAASEIPPEFAAAFREKAGGGTALRHDAFVELALYHPRLGYYRRPARRIGYGPGSDFITAASSRPFFGEWVAAAALALLGGRPAGEFAFIEIGAEPEGGILAGIAHPFGRCQAIGPEGRLEIEGRCIVFSNELFDAQPFRRFLFRDGTWREIGVALAEKRLVEAEMEVADPPPLPSRVAEGYRFDAPTGAVSLLERIASPGWTGLFLAFDYGKAWRELAEQTPGGTARAYRRHAQSNDLLAFPGEQDLTCHLCWDWMEAVLRRNGFAAPVLESQEAFFVRHAASALQAAADPSLPSLDPGKRALAQLLHPAHFGHKFQVLHGARW